MNEEYCTICLQTPSELKDEGVNLVDTRLHFRCLDKHSEKICRFCISNPKIDKCPLCRSDRLCFSNVQDLFILRNLD